MHYHSRDGMPPDLVVLHEPYAPVPYEDAACLAVADAIPLHLGIGPTADNEPIQSVTVYIVVDDFGRCQVGDCYS